MPLNWHTPCSSKLLVVSMVLCATAGPACLLPPPIDEESPDANRPPFIEPLLPPPGEPIALNCSGQATLFLANIGDDNLRDTLYYRFFIDYYRRDPEDILDTRIGEAPPTPGRARVAQESITANNPILLERPADVHIVELLLSDREFNDSIDDQPSVVGRVVVEGGLTALYTWAVNPIECN